MNRRGSRTITVPIMAGAVGCRARVLGVFMTAISPWIWSIVLYFFQELINLGLPFTPNNTAF